jgi:hypothetical protein
MILWGIRTSFRDVVVVLRKVIVQYTFMNDKAYLTLQRGVGAKSAVTLNKI